MKSSPNQIEQLKNNEVFVFGSNTEGRHDAGAAVLALQRFGAIYGRGIGMNGQSYAIPTKKYSKKLNGKGWELTILPISEIAKYVIDFINYTSVHKDLDFLVTKIGCGLAGYTPEQIAPLFVKAKNNENIYLPQEFIDIIENK